MMTWKSSIIFTVAILLAGMAIEWLTRPSDQAREALVGGRSEAEEALFRERVHSPREPDITVDDILSVALEIETAGPGDANRTPESLKAQKEITQRIYRLSPGQIDAFVKLVAEDARLPAIGKRFFVRKALEALAGKDPIGSLRLFESRIAVFGDSTMGIEVASGMLTVMAGMDPMLAAREMRRMQEEHPELHPENARSNIISAARSDPALAFQIAKEFYARTAPDEFARRLCSIAASVETDEARMNLLQLVRKELPEFSDEKTRNDIYRAVIITSAHRLAASGFEAAGEWMALANFSTEEQRLFLFTFELSMNAPAGDCAKWIDWADRSVPFASLSVEADKNKWGGAIRSLAGCMATSDHLGTSRWLEGLPEGQLKNCCICGYAYALAEKMPEKAAEWVVKLPDAESRNIMLGRIAERADWPDSEAAEAFFKRFRPSE